LRWNSRAETIDWDGSRRHKNIHGPFRVPEEKQRTVVTSANRRRSERLPSSASAAHSSASTKTSTQLILIGACGLGAPTNESGTRLCALGVATPPATGTSEDVAMLLSPS